MTSLSHCMAAFFNKETLSTETGNAFDCPKCAAKEEGKALASTIREYYIRDPPKMLVMQLKRFLGSGYTVRKNAKRIEIPLHLNLDNYVLLPRKHFLKNIGDNPLQSKIETMKPEENLNIYQYDLYGIVSHSGGMSGGHYVSYVKHGKT